MKFRKTVRYAIYKENSIRLWAWWMHIREFLVTDSIASIHTNVIRKMAHQWDKVIFAVGDGGLNYLGAF